VPVQNVGVGSARSGLQGAQTALPTLCASNGYWLLAIGYVLRMAADVWLVGAGQEHLEQIDHACKHACSSRRHATRQGGMGRALSHKAFKGWSPTCKPQGGACPLQSARGHTIRMSAGAWAHLEGHEGEHDLYREGAAVHKVTCAGAGCSVWSLIGLARTESMYVLTISPIASAEELLF